MGKFEARMLHIAVNDLFGQFFTDPSMSAADAQKQFVDIIANAD